MKPTEQAAREAAKQIACKIIPLSELESQIHQQLVYDGAQWAISQMQPEWVAITNKNDLPKESCKAFFFDKPTQTIICGSFSPTKDEINFILANASHYMIIQEPQPPTN